MAEAQEQPERLSGRVKWFNSSKGFGFITLENSDEEVFVHQSNIDTTGFRSLREGEEVEFVLVIGEDGKKKAFQVSGPQGAPPLGSADAPRTHSMGRDMRAFDPSTYAAAYGYGPPPGTGPANPGQTNPIASPGGRGRGMPTTGFPFPPPMGGPDPAAAAAAAAAAAYMGYYPMTPPGPGHYGSPGGGYPQQMYARGRGGFFPGGRNWAGARPPPPGQPGFSSGLQVVVHNLPWDCTWQQLKDAFASCGEITRADVVFDSRGRSRGFGIVRFQDKDTAEAAVDKMNNSTIGGRVVSVRIDRFA